MLSYSFQSTLKKVNLTRYYSLFRCQSNCPVNCWNCHKELQKRPYNLFCGNCCSIQIPKCDNYFELFGIQRSFDINVNHLEKTYQTLQKKVHPDRFFNKSEDEKQYSIKASGCINEAFRILKEPVSRAEYILQIFGNKINTKVPQDFLSDVLNYHEIMETSTDINELKNIYEKCKSLKTNLENELKDYVKINDDQSNVTDPEKAGETISKIRYMIRIVDTLKQKLPHS